MENTSKQVVLILHLLLLILCTFCVCKEITEEAASTKISSAIEKRSLDQFGFVDNIEQDKETKTVPGETGSAKEDYDSLLAHKLTSLDTAKRRMDRFAFAGTLGKRLDDLEQANDGDVEKRRMDRLSFLSNLGKRGGMDLSYLGNAGKRSKLDRYMFTGNLGKRGRMDRYSFIGNLGKRRGSMDRYSFISNLGKRPSMDRYSFIGTLGKRGEDLSPFAENLENRQTMNAYSFAGSLGRSVAVDNADSGDILVNDEDRDFGKRGKLDMKSLYGQLGKRSKRSLFYPWGGVRYTINKPMRGIDKYSFAARLGKRGPDYRFLPTLGKRTYLTSEGSI